ncbi:MAG: ABC transporter ATP-binding protein [Hyphomicrobiales bacterium]
MYFETRNIDVHYDQVHALKGVGIGLDQGEIVALIGSNGAGKTTTLKAITGLQAPSAGEIWFDGERIDRLSPSQIVVRGITMVPEGRRVFPYMSVKDNLLMGAFTRRDKGEIAAKLDHALTRFPRLKERWRQDAGTLSGGEQQMLVISRALMSSPKLLLLDEPSLGIAPKLVQDIARSIVSINRDDGIGVILVEQNSRMALKISHRAYALSLGQVALTGRSSDLRDDDRIRALYLGGEI